MASVRDKRLLVAEQSKRQAAHYLERRNFARAFAHYLVLLKLLPNTGDEVQQDFVFALRELGISLEEDRKIDELFNCYQQAIEALPECKEIHNNFGAHLVR